MASIVVLGPCRHSACLVEDGHRVREVSAAELAARPCDLVIAADGSLDHAALAAWRRRPDAPPLILLLARAEPPAVASARRDGAFDALAAEADAATVRAVVARALRYRDACRERDDARAERDAVFAALQQLAADAAQLVHDVKSPGTAVRQALRAVAGHLDADQHGLLNEFVAELEHVEELLRAVFALVQPLPEAAAPAPLAEVFAAVQQSWVAAAGGRPQLELQLPPVTLTLPGAAGVWVAALRAALDHAVAGSAAGRVELAASVAPGGGARLEIRLPEDPVGPAPLVPPGRDSGVGMAFCRRVVATYRGRLEVAAATVVDPVRCWIELTGPPP